MKDFSVAGIGRCVFRRVARAVGANIVTIFIAGSALAGPLTPSPAKGEASVQSTSIAAHYSSGGISSLEMADAALAAAALEQDRINAIYADEERACLPEFFTTACIEDAKERRRQALLQWRPIQLEANLFKRRARAAENEQTMEKKRKLQEARQPDTDPLQAKPPHHAAREDTLPSAAAIADDASRGSMSVTDSARRSDTRMKRESRGAKKKAAKRAANVAAYDRKVLAAQRRQQEIARRKAAREEERRRPRGQPEQDAGGSAPQE